MLPPKVLRKRQKPPFWCKQNTINYATLLVSPYQEKDQPIYLDPKSNALLCHPDSFIIKRGKPHLQVLSLMHFSATLKKTYLINGLFRHMPYTAWVKNFPLVYPLRNT